LTPDLAKRLARVYPGLSMPATGVAHVAGVAEVARYARKPQQIRPLRPLRPEIDKGAKAKGEGVATARDAVADAIEERRAIIGDTCPAPYADTFARLNNQKPSAVSTEEWERAVNDGGVFLDAWGALAAELKWTAADLFDVPRDDRPGGIVWRLNGERVDTLGAGHARLSDGRMIVKVEKRK
jgi:hypothetical protein